MVDRDPPEHVFLWQIENFDENTAARHDCIHSPISRSKRLGSIAWRLIFFPSDPQNPEYIAVYLNRLKRDHGPAELHLIVEFCLFDKDGRERYNQMLEENFSRGKIFGPTKFLLRGVLIDGKEEFLPSNVLTLKCRIWKSRRKAIFPSTRTVISTRIPVEKLSFTWTIRDSRKVPSKRVIRVESNSVGNGFNLECRSVDEDENSTTLHLFVRPKNSPKTRFQMSAKVTVLSGRGKTLCQVESSHVFKRKTHDTWHLPNLVWGDSLRDSEVGDRVDLSLEFAITSGSSNTRIQESLTAPDAFESEDFSLEGDLRSLFARMRSTPAEHGDMAFDLRSSREENARIVPFNVGVSNADIMLKTSEDDQTCFAHKMILSARSAVFRKVFNDFDSQKKRWLQLTLGNTPISRCKLTVKSGTITVRVSRFQDIAEISDMSSEILSQLLEFMYTDVVKPSSLNNAILLLKISSQYQILALQNKIREYLKSICLCIDLQPEQFMDDCLEDDEFRKYHLKFVESFNRTYND